MDGLLACMPHNLFQYLLYDPVGSACFGLIKQLVGCAKQLLRADIVLRVAHDDPCTHS